MKAIQSIKAIQYRAYRAYAENRFVDLPAPVGYFSRYSSHTDRVHDRQPKEGRHEADTDDPGDVPRHRLHERPGAPASLRYEAFSCGLEGYPCLTDVRWL